MRDPPSLHTCVAYAKPEVVLHLAAQPLVRRSYADPVGTWSTNVLGTLHLLEALKGLQHPCAVVILTTDKVYENREWEYGYREPDRLGGYDPYSASKAVTELAVASWKISIARGSNVIGCGDWAAGANPLDCCLADLMATTSYKQHQCNAR